MKLQPIISNCISGAKQLIGFNPIRDTLNVNISTWMNIETEFIKHFKVRTSTVDNIWELTKLKHGEKDNLANFML